MAYINVDNLWNAEEGGKMPWTIFAYPASLADSQRLPHDEEARQFLARLLELGLRVGVWARSDLDGTCYFACPFEDRDRVYSAIKGLERSGEFPPDFANQRTEYLFSLVGPT